MDEYWHRMKELRRSLKEDWENLWLTKYDDQRKAEGVSSKDYHRLFVQKGEILYATRNFKPLSFKEIFEKQVGYEDAAKIDIDPKVGGWGKFARTNFPTRKPIHKRDAPREKVDYNQHQRKGGAGWLNTLRINRKNRVNKE